MVKPEWIDERSAALLKVILDEKAKGRVKRVWADTAKTFNRRTGLEYTPMQCTNHYTDLRKKWRAYYALENMTGIAFDLDTGLVDDKELKTERIIQWKEFHTNHANTILKGPIPYLDNRRKVFHLKSATGTLGFSPTLAKFQSMAAQGSGSDGMGPARNESSGSSGEDKSYAPVSNVESSLQESMIRDKAFKGKKRVGQCFGSTMSKKSCGSLEKIYEVLKLNEEQNRKPTLERRLVEAVKNLKQVKEQGPEFLGACLKYLVDEKYDKLFVELDTEAERWSFLNEFAKKYLQANECYEPVNDFLDDDLP